MGKNAKIPPASSGRILACSIAALLLASESATLAQEELWIGTESGNWSVPANWQGGVVPVGGPESTLRFTVGGSSAITAANDLPAPFSIGNLRFVNTGSGPFTVSGGALQLTGASPEILQAGTGDVTLSTPLILSASDGGAVRVTGSGLGNVTISGPISETGGSGSLVIAGEPLTSDSQIITISGENSSTGGITLASGNLALGSGAIGANSAPLVVKGGTLRFAQGASFTNPVSLHSDLVVTGDTAGQLGSISSAVPGTGLTMRTTGGPLAGNAVVPRLTMAGSSPYTGATRIYSGPASVLSYAAGDMLLTGGGAISHTSEIDVRSGGAIVIDGSAAGGSLERINDVAPIKLHGGRLTLRASAGSATPQVETVGALKVAGYSTITVDVSADSMVGGQILASSVERMGTGTLFLRGIPMGANPPAATSRGRVLLAFPPPDLVGTGNGVTTPIVPYAIGQPLLTDNFINTGLVTYSQGVGLRLLEANEYATQFGVEGSNVRLTNSPTSDHGDQTVNSLVLANGVSLSGTGQLTVSSGVVLAQGVGTIFQKLNFGTTDGKIFNQGNLTVWDVAGTRGFTKAGNGILRLSGTNTSIGPLTINAGTVSYNSAAMLGDSSSPVLLDGPHVQMTYTGAVDEVLSKDIIINSGDGWVISEATSKTLHLAGQISGSGSLILKAEGFGVIRLTGNNTLTGSVLLERGDLEINSDAALGQGSELSITRGAVRLLGSWVTEKTIRTGTSSVEIDTGGFEARVNGSVIGTSAWLNKSGYGTLSLTSRVEPRQVNVVGGTLRLAEGALASAANWEVVVGGILHSDQTTPASTRHLNTDAKMSIGGELLLTGRADTLVSEKISELASGPSTTVSLAPGLGSGSEVSLHTDSLVLSTPGLMIRADDLGSQSRFTVGDAVPLRSGIAVGVYTKAFANGAELFATYDGTSDMAGVIGFRVAPHTSATTIRNGSNGGIIPETANILAPNGGTVVVGASSEINGLVIAPGGGVALTPDQVLRLETGSILTQLGSGRATITGGTLDLGDDVATLAVLRDLEISSAMVGGSSLAKIGQGELSLNGPISITGGISVLQGTLRLSGTNTYAGPTVVRDALWFDSDAALGNGSVLDPSGGGLHLGGPWTTSRRISMASDGDADLFLHGHRANLNGPLEGFYNLTIHGPGEVSLTAASPYAGSLVLGGDLTLTGLGSTRGNVRTTSGALVLDNRSLASSDRFRDGASFSGTSPITLIGNADITVNEVIGNLTVPALGTRAGLKLVSPGEQRTTLKAQSLLFVGGGLRTIAGDDLGGTSSSSTRVTFQTAPILDGNLLVRTLAADVSDGIPESLATYDRNSDEYGIIGVRPIRESEYDTSTVILNTISTRFPNYLVSSAVTVGAGGEPINSLTMRGEGMITMTPEQTLAIRSGYVLVQSNANALIEGGRLELGTAQFIVNGSLTLGSALTSSRLEKYGPGVLRLGAVDLSDTVSVLEGTLVLEGSVSNSGATLLSPATTALGATLAGSGDIEGRVIISGTLAPGDDGVGLIRTQYLTLQPASALSLDLDSATAFDRLEVAGTLYLAGPVTLNLGLGFDPVDFEDSFTVISNLGSAPMSLASGHFTFGGSALHEGSYFLADDQKFQISYTGGDGNDVVLRPVPEPSTSLLALSGLGALLSRRRRSTRCAR